MKSSRNSAVYLCFAYGHAGNADFLQLNARQSGERAARDSHSLPWPLGLLVSQRP